MLVVGHGAWPLALTRVLRSLGFAARRMIDPTRTRRGAAAERRRGRTVAIVFTRQPLSMAWVNRTIHALRTATHWCEKILFVVRDTAQEEAVLALDPCATGQASFTVRASGGNAVLIQPLRLAQLLRTVYWLEPISVERWSDVESASRMPRILEALRHAERVAQAGSAEALSAAVARLVDEMEPVHWAGLLRDGRDAHRELAWLDNLVRGPRNFAGSPFGELVGIVRTARVIVEASTGGGSP